MPNYNISYNGKEHSITFVYLPEITDNLDGFNRKELTCEELDYSWKLAEVPGKIVEQTIERYKQKYFSEG